MKKLCPFGWFGGKFSHLKWLLPLLPETPQYCEPYGGSAAVLINKEPVSVETYNDIDGEVTNFFRMLREKKEELIEMIGLTPFSKEEFVAAIKSKTKDPLERARLFYVKARQVRTGLAQGATPGRWAHCVVARNKGISVSVSRWLGAVDTLPEIAERLLRVQIENEDAIKVIQKYDHPDTLFYLDPPYPLEDRNGRAYRYEYNTAQHECLAKVLHEIKGKAIISGYHGTMDTLYPTWHSFDAPPSKCHSSKQIRVEVVWANFPLKLIKHVDTP